MTSTSTPSSSPANVTQEGFVLTVTPQGCVAAAGVLDCPPGRFVSAADRVLGAALGVRVRRGDHALSATDRLPEGFVRVTTLGALGVSMVEVRVPYTAAFGIAAGEAGVGVDEFLEALGQALTVTWSERVRVFLEHDLLDVRVSHRR